MHSLLELLLHRCPANGWRYCRLMDLALKMRRHLLSGLTVFGAVCLAFVTRSESSCRQKRIGSACIPHGEFELTPIGARAIILVGKCRHNKGTQR